MMWLVEEPEGIEFEALSETKKYDFALDQSHRKDKDERWREIWSAIAWSHMPIEERRKSRFPNKTTGPDFKICPLCEGELGVDEEYMQSRYGSFAAMPPEKWTYFCNDCEEAGTYTELIRESYDRTDEEKYRRGVWR